MKRTILILLVAVFVASAFAIVGCSKPDPTAQPSPADTSASNPQASAPAAPAVPKIVHKMTPEATAPAPAPVTHTQENMRHEMTPVQMEHPEPGTDKKIPPHEKKPIPHDSGM
jgi:PBP1b-binding outer membrane lipoprotein LpoB